MTWLIKCQSKYWHDKNNLSKVGYFYNLIIRLWNEIGTKLLILENTYTRNYLKRLLYWLIFLLLKLIMVLNYSAPTCNNIISWGRLFYLREKSPVWKTILYSTQYCSVKVTRLARSFAELPHAIVFAEKATWKSLVTRSLGPLWTLNFALTEETEETIEAPIDFLERCETMTSRTVMLYPNITSKRRSFVVFFHFAEVSYIFLQLFASFLFLPE